MHPNAHSRDDGAQFGQPIGPFNHRDARFLLEIFMKAGGANSRFGLQSIKIEMEQRQPTLALLVDQGKGGRQNPCRNSQAFGQPFYQLGFARAQIANQTNDPTCSDLLAPLPAKCFRLLRTFRMNDISQSINYCPVSRNACSPQD